MDLIDYGARWYDPGLGRFLSPDTIIPDPTNPQSLNRYSYVYNNPLKYRDPSGHIVETIWDVANIAIGVGSLSYNLYEGNYVDAAIDAGGLVVDVAAAAIPIVPGGAGAAIKAVRLANTVDNVVDTVNAVDNVVDGVKAVDIVKSAGSLEDIIIGPYKDVRKMVTNGDQAHHLNQDAAFRDVIPRNDGVSVNLNSNAFTQPGTPHYEFHRYLEGFWDQFRDGGTRFGDRPIVGEYNQAVRQAATDAGFSPGQADIMEGMARLNQQDYGLLDSDPIPRIPGRINQKQP